LRYAHDGAEPLRGLCALEIHKFVEKEFL